MSKDPNPGWTRAPWSIGNGASASQLMPPPPPRPPLNPQPPTASTSGSTDGLDLSASRWEDYFAEKLSCPVRGGSFRVYLSERAAPDAPLVVCLHGAGYTGLSWALVAAELRGFCTLAALVRKARMTDTVSKSHADAPLASSARSASQCTPSTGPPRARRDHNPRRGGSLRRHAHSGRARGRRAPAVAALAGPFGPNAAARAGRTQHGRRGGRARSEPRGVAAAGQPQGADCR